MHYTKEQPLAQLHNSQRQLSNYPHEEATFGAYFNAAASNRALFSAISVASGCCGSTDFKLLMNHNKPR